MTLDFLWACSFWLCFVSIFGLRYLRRFNGLMKVFSDLLMISLGAQIASIIMMFI